MHNIHIVQRFVFSALLLVGAVPNSSAQDVALSAENGAERAARATRQQSPLTGIPSLPPGVHPYVTTSQYQYPSATPVAPFTQPSGMRFENGGWNSSEARSTGFGNSTTGNESTHFGDSAFPQTPAVLPPDLPPRAPIESAMQSPPAAARPPVTTSIAPGTFLQKAPLAWRSRIYQLENSNAGSERILNCSFDDAIMTLVSTLPAQGLRVEVLNSKAGELLAAPIDAQSKQRYIFALWESDQGTVNIKGAPLVNNKQGADIIQNVLRLMTPGSRQRGSL